VQRKAQRRNKTTEGSVKIHQEGIEHVQFCTGGTLFRVQREEVSRRDTGRVVEHSVSSTRCASS
jgi:hypothetical protein